VQKKTTVDHNINQILVYFAPEIGRNLVLASQDFLGNRHGSHAAVGNAE